MSIHEHKTVTGESVPVGWTPLPDQSEDQQGFHYEYDADNLERFPIFVSSYQAEEGAWTVEGYLTYPAPGEQSEGHLVFGWAASLSDADKFCQGYQALTIYLLP